MVLRWIRPHSKKYAEKMKLRKARFEWEKFFVAQAWEIRGSMVATVHAG